MSASHPDGKKVLQRISLETGGGFFEVSDKHPIEKIYTQIEEELRTQYVASYTPTNAKLDGSYRKIDIECKGDGLKAQARKGYYAIAPSD